MTLVTIIVLVLSVRFIESTNNTNMGYFSIVFSLQTFSTTIMPIMLLLFAANTVSSEKTNSTIRNILVSGCSKSQFIISKIIVSLMFQLILMVIVAITAIFISYILFGFGNIAEDGFVIMAQHQFWTQFVISYALLIIVFFTTILFGILISTIAQNNISSITIAISSYIVLEIIKIKLKIVAFIYSSYIEFPLNNLSELMEGFHTSWTPKLYYYLSVNIFWIFIFLFIALLAIKKQEFK